MIRKFIQTSVFIGTLALSINIQANTVKPAETIPPRPTAAINQYIDQMVKKYKFNKKALTKIMNEAQYDPEVIHWITHPMEQKPWDFYRNFFVRQDRINNGVIYWQTHKKILDDVQQHYGVPPNVIIAIIGIESYFGEHAGTYNELNALTTLSFYYPSRAHFFKSELTHFLLLAQHEKLNPALLKGSYAGALGIPQFMPSSYRHYGVDYSNNHSINLFTNHSDAIASIGNYLSQAGWVGDQPVAIPAKVHGKAPSQLISQTGLPKYTLSQLSHYRIQPTQTEPAVLKAALIAMQNTDSTEYWIVFKNFHAIMKYNPRTTYALAVFELSRAIKEAYEQQTKRSLPITSIRETGRS